MGSGGIRCGSLPRRLFAVNLGHHANEFKPMRRGGTHTTDRTWGRNATVANPLFVYVTRPTVCSVGLDEQRVEQVDGAAGTEQLLGFGDRIQSVFCIVRERL